MEVAMCTDKEKVEYVCKRLQVDMEWVFLQAYWYAEKPEPKWYVREKVKEFRIYEILPQPVKDFVDKLILDKFRFLVDWNEG